MTEGGKTIRDTTPVATASPFARLRPLVSGGEKDVAASLTQAAKALASYEKPARIHVRLLDTDNNTETFDHWDVEAGTTKAAARRGAPKAADVVVVMRRDTWLQIAQGQLSPFDALFNGKVRVGGDLELAKGLARHLSDPSVPFVSPC